MKHLFLPALFAIVSLAMQAQSVAFSKNGEVLPNGTTVEIRTAVWDDTLLGLALEPEINVVNLTGETIDVRIDQFVLEAPGDEYGFPGFCFQQCVYEAQNISQTGPLAPGEDEKFHVNYFIVDAEKYFTASMEYTVTRNGSFTDQSTVVINYTFDENSYAGIAAAKETDQVCFSGNSFYNLPPATTQLAVINLKGQTICTLEAGNRSSLSLPSGFEKGIYIAKICNSNATYSVLKFIVQ